MAYDRIEPIGPERLELYLAQVCRTIANVHRGRGKRAFRLADFLFKWGPAEDDGVADKVRRIFGALKGKSQ